MVRLLVVMIMSEKESKKRKNQKKNISMVEAIQFLSQKKSILNLYSHLIEMKNIMFLLITVATK